MATRELVSRRELLDRWKGIEEEEENDDDDNPDSSLRRRIHRNKEKWFADTFNFLITLAKECHIWCGFFDLMGPLLETFYNYFKDERQDSPLKRLWKRISDEMQHCIQCVSQHHQAQEMYNMEYESSSIGPLLDVLQRLDKERVTLHLKDINARVVQGQYDLACDNVQVVCVLYEVLMFPFLLEDQPLFTEFESFVEAIDNKHELALAGQQQFPGVYALFFFKRTVRSVGHRLAGSKGKLRRATDLEPLQPLLKKFIGFLESESLPLTLETSVPRAQLDRVSIWIGIKSLLGFLEPPAFEDGILEQYPIFLDIVLNHISGDSVEFSHAVTCLKLLFEMLGCKLWLRSTLSSSVMRNTLLGQCFHTRNEKSHKEIFALFLPFLQSLEALQDGEHEKQRRHFLYFLLHQVPVSSNFSIMIRKLACQIALLIVLRGYKMNPPCPPFECAHMWGPSLMTSLKDCSLHSSLRQPAFDLIQTIIVSDATALVSSIMNFHMHPNGSRASIHSNIDEDYIGLPKVLDTAEKDACSWCEFDLQSKITSMAWREWMCIPMLWIDVLVEIEPSKLPISFSKAVFWARSRFSLIELENSAEMALSVKSWLSSSASDISSSLGWKVPTGSDDGGSGNTSKNSVEVLTKFLPLVKTFNRLTIQYLLQMWQGELRKQWTWEPQMSESLILSLLDPNDNVRQFGKCMLEQISNSRGLSSGLKFLCSSKHSLSATILGLRHAMKLVQLDFDLLKFQSLHHFLFVLYKLIKDKDMLATQQQENTPNKLGAAKFSSQGGFLRQPNFDSLSVNMEEDSSDVDIKLRAQFSFLLSEMAWPFVCRCLFEGKEYFQYSFCQMTCVRLLEILPVLFERLSPLHANEFGDSGMIIKYKSDFCWLHDLINWGKSPLKVVIVYWKRALTSFLNFLKGSCCQTTSSTIKIIENLFSSDSFSLEELIEQTSLLSVHLSKETSGNFERSNINSKSLLSESLSFGKKDLAADMQLSSLADTDVQIICPPVMTHKKDAGELVILSDDEVETKRASSKAVVSDINSGRHSLDGKTVKPVYKNNLDAEPAKEKVSGMKVLNYAFKDLPERDSMNCPILDSPKQDSSNSINECGVDTLIRSKGVDANKKEVGSKCRNRSISRKFADEARGAKNLDEACGNIVVQAGSPLLNTQKSDSILSDIDCEAEDDPLETALKSVGRQKLHIGKPAAPVSKRQVIQLTTAVDNRSSRLQRLEAAIKRFKPPRLDDWYKSILEIHYLATVGLASARNDENPTVRKLKEIPVNFQSPEQYVEIFQPLVLEEFKAQLHNSFLEMSSWEEMFFCTLAVMSVERVDDFHLVRFVHDDSDSAASKSFSENDLVLLTKDPPQKTSQDVHMVGKVERREKDNKRNLSILLIRFYLQNGSLRLSQARRNLIERSKWHTCRIMSITPQLREFQALSSIKGIPLLPVILNPMDDSLCDNASKEANLHKLSQPMQKILRSSFNDSQLQAISASIGLPNLKRDFDLSLVQGPPGTGKTRTIVAILSCLLAARSPPDGSFKRNITSHNNSRQRISQAAAIARAWQDAALAKELNDVLGKSQVAENGVRGRVLICAQSNAAVDELVSRISSQGLYGSDGKMYKPYLVRVGNAKTVHPNSLPFFIDILVDQRLAEDSLHSSNAKNDSGVNSSVELRSNLEKIVERIRFYEAKRANLKDGNSNSKCPSDDYACKGDEKEMTDSEIGFQLRKLYEQKKQIYKDLGSAQAQEKRANEEVKSLRHKLRKSILKEAHIVVTTLSGCGGDLFGVCSESMSNSRFGSPSEHTLFDAVVIDEAAQALEPATLIPLQLLKSSGTKCIMVGDPKQLPATVLSNIASKFLYECSMFERLQRAGHPVILLTQQYRMHPEICRFPSLHFYDNKLLNGSQMSSKSAPFHEMKELGPYVFFDIVDGQEFRGKNSGALSLYNECEADAAVEVLKFFKKRYPSEFVGGRIGIITPYKCQLSLLRSRFSSAFGSSSIAEIEFNTVDGFQGREVDILLLSTVRAAPSSSTAPGINSSSIGFVADVRRMNVALTRARLSLWILGNARTLLTNRNWEALLKDAQERKLIISAKRPYKSMFKTASLRNSDSDNYPIPEKHEDKISGETPVQDNQKNKSERKKKHVASETQNKSTSKKDKSALLLGGKDAQCNKKESRDAYSSGLVTKSDKERKGKDRSILGNKPMSNRHMEPENVRNHNNHSEMGGGHKLISMQDSRKPESPTEVDGSQRVEASPPSTECKQKGRDLNDGGGKHLNKKYLKLENSKNARNHSEHEINGQHSLTRVKESKRPKRLIEVSGSHDVEASSTECKQKEKDLNIGGGASKQASSSKDLISKRKEQRKAVDDILFSCLISSKKLEKTKVPSKRPLSTSTANDSMKPPKTRIVRPGSSALH